MGGVVPFGRRKIQEIVRGLKRGQSTSSDKNREKIMYRDERGVWDGVRWDGQHAVFFALGESDEGQARRKLRGRL